MRFRTPEPIPLLFIITAVMVLIGLGLWQTARLAWKNDLIATVRQAQSHPALGTLPEKLDGFEYRHVVLTGTFLHNQTLHKAGGKQGEPYGFFLLTPFRLEDDGRTVLVNRGFSPPGKESMPEGVQTVYGILRPLHGKRFFSPENKPDDNLWFYEDLAAMSQQTGIELLPLMVEATGAHGRGIYPIPSDGKIVLRNDHLGYAITWFSLALIGIGMFALYYRAPEKNA